MKPQAASAHTRAPLAVSYRPLDSLVPYAKNARTHSEAQVGKLQASLAEYGWTNPIAVADNGIIAGHGRLLAAVALRERGVAIPGLADAATAPVIDLSHLTAKQRRAYVLLDNRLALDAGWDDEVLLGELTDLRLDGFDLDLTGFGADELGKMLGVRSDPLIPSVSGELPPPNYHEQYGVIVICKDTAHQEATYNDLKAQGFNLRVVTT